MEESQHKGLLELVELEESQLHAHQIIESFQAHQKILSDKNVRPRKFQEGNPLQWKDFQKVTFKMVWTIYHHEILFCNNTYELAHLEREKYRMINHDKLKHFHSCETVVSKR